MVADSCFQGWIGVIRTSLNTMSYYCTLLFFDCNIIGASKGTFVVYKSSPWSLPQNQHQWFQEWQWSLSYISLTIILQCLLIKAHPIYPYGEILHPHFRSQNHVSGRAEVRPCASWGYSEKVLPQTRKIWSSLGQMWSLNTQLKGKSMWRHTWWMGALLKALYSDLERLWTPFNISQKCTNRDQLAEVRYWGKGDKSDGENTRTPRSVGKCLRASYEMCGNLGLL